MHFKQHYLGCLSQASYTLGSEGEAVVVDPRRDVEEYLAETQKAGLKIKYVIETHLHADFVSGHRELAERSGAQVVFSSQANVGFPHLAVRNGDELKIGKLTLTILETPGHTLESICVLGREEDRAFLLTGDTLFIGDVGRPDLVGSGGPDARSMAGFLYDSLREKILPLPDSVIVYPAHGAGSLCGRNLSSETFSTLGDQRKTNWALKPMTREAFVEALVQELPEVPRHFRRDVEINRKGADPLSRLKPTRRVAADHIGGLARTGATLLDVRNGDAFGERHLPASVNIGLGGQFAAWAGALLDPDSSLVLVVEEEEQAQEAAMRLARVGLESVTGFISPADWQNAGLPTLSLPQLSVDELQERLGEVDVIDVRRRSEYVSGHVPQALHMPLDSLHARARDLDRSRPTAVICAGGYRSSAGASLLERDGFSRLFNVVGGTSAWIAAGKKTDS